MKISQDLVHISIYVFFLILGGIIGRIAGILYLFSISLIIVLMFIVIRTYFIKRSKQEAKKEVFQ
jgi:antibiotic biosynthesis monooxygenase (ABM) superfamily enzyme